MSDFEKGRHLERERERDDDAMSWQHCDTASTLYHGSGRQSLDGKTATPSTFSHAAFSSGASSTAHLTRIAPPAPPPRKEWTRASCWAVFGGFLSLFATFGQMNAFGTFEAWYTGHQLRGMQPGVVAWIGSVQLWVFFLSGGPIGKIFDFYGPRRLMIAGTIIYVLALLLTSFANAYWQYLLAHGLLFGLGVGLMFYPCLSSVSTHFTKYRATALGIVASGSSFGGVMYPLLLERLFAHPKIGFGWAVRISALLSVVLCVLAVLTVSRYEAPGQNLRVTAKLRDRHAATADGARLSEMCRDPRFALLALGSSFVALGLFIPFIFIVSYAATLPALPGTSPATIPFTVLTVLNAGGILGRFLPACASDYFGRFTLLFPSALLSGVLCLALWLPAKTLPPLIVFAALYGFTSGAFVSLITPCVAQISDVRVIGSRIGVLYSVIATPAVIGPPTAGALLQATHGSYTGMILFAGLALVVGAFFILAAKLKVDARLLARV
ncbi:Monocarboxylate permease-like protein [Mycena chlorophos]|uniref:Monocarboxylate permease-like protein n=1 Tax=Mycena chlorophos TaxID=658473 RepID=A0A8H6W1T7_MYCCL|nr:Monocarboxylate permease-like protein [Mycena chlorophos]